MKNKGFKDIELDRVLEEVRSFSLFPESGDYISEERFTTDEALLEERYRTIDDYRMRLLDEHELSSFPSISHIFNYMRDTHRDVEGEDVYKVGEFLLSYHRMLGFLSEEERMHEEDVDLYKDILSSLDSEGIVREDHPRLLPLKRALDRIKDERASFSNSFMKANQEKLQSEVPVYRNERVVIPIRSDRKSQVDCYVQGSSNSGQTLFVEPFMLVELNNNVVLAEERIRAEKMKILHELSEKVRYIAPHLKKKMEEVIIFDFHYSFASYVRRHRCQHPKRGEKVHLIEARHPLIGAKAVPIEVEIDEKVRGVVFSGANAGGKTVTMKTIALLAALNQISGFIPASELSTLPYFDRILTDIGDGQSIENEASTFSSHLKNIAYITKKATSSSLVLLDELGSGTDPEEGSALSVATLEYLSSRARLTLVTSHYSKVKNYAYAKEEMMNSSMEFNEKSGKPTYRVISGLPGESHAIEAAIRMGLPKQIIEDAKGDLKDEESRSGKIITSLISKSRTLDRKITELELEKRALSKERDALERKEAELEKMRFELEKKGVSDLSDWSRNVRRELEGLVRDLRTGELTGEKTRSVKAFIEKLDRKEETVRKKVAEKKEKYEQKDERNLVFSEGEDVLCGSARSKGRIIKDNGGGKFTVLLESGLRLTLSSSMIYKREEKTTRVVLSHFESSVKKAEYVMDLRGLTLKEATDRLDDQMEAALLSGLSSFSIIHGLGDGILQKGVHDYLRGRREVEEYRFALPEDGGMGKTYVKLRI